MAEWNSFNAAATWQEVSITTCCDPNVGQVCSNTSNSSYYCSSSNMSYPACQAFAGNWGMTSPCPDPGAWYYWAFKQCTATDWIGTYYRLDCARYAQWTIQCDWSCQ